MQICVTELPKEGSDFKMDKPGAKSLKTNSVIYADFESILAPYNTNDKEHKKCKKLNKHLACFYSINVVNSHDQSSKQSYDLGDNAVSAFCKEIRNLAYKQPMIDIIEREIHEYQNAKHCHICKTAFGDAKKQKST